MGALKNFSTICNSLGTGGEAYMVFRRSGGDLNGDEPMPKLSNEPTIKEERQTHNQRQPKGYGRFSHHLDQLDSPLSSQVESTSGHSNM